MLALNLALIAATPIDGAHYFIDILGGGAVAALAITASSWLCRPLAAGRAAATEAVAASA